LIASNLKSLSIFDIGYCSSITDEGLAHFGQVRPKWNIVELTICGLTEVTNKGFASMLDVCDDTLQMLNMNLNDQETVTGEVTKAIAQC
jgi:hypothetical protein